MSAPPVAEGNAAQVRAVRALPPAELEARAIACGAKPFQARALRDWIWVRGARSFDAATNVPKRVRTALASEFEASAARILETSLSADGTRKFLLGLSDGETIEMVLIPQGDRVTLCMSTQVGCPVACVFCASGLDGIRRNLTSAELLEQFVLAQEQLSPGPSGSRPLTNLVVMGIGEPMLNLDALEDALTRIADPELFAFSPRRVTVSTSGYPDRIRRLAGLGKPFQLAVSLHAADPELRKRLVPTATVEPIELVHAAQDYARMTGREPTFEVVLLDGINDRPNDAGALVHLLRETPCTVNLIPWNRVDGVDPRFMRPGDALVERFQSLLEAGGLKVTWRRRRGHDRDAACGQLRLRSGH